MQKHEKYFWKNLCLKDLKLKGYGDSTGLPSEEGIVKDVLALYNLIMSYNNNTTIYLYGHSLGTGIVSHVSKILTESNRN